MLDSKDPNYGYDAQKGEFTDMIRAGIIDPTKVVRHALQDAASVAGLLITTEAMVAEKPEPKTPPAMPPGGWAWAAWTSNPPSFVDQQGRLSAPTAGRRPFILLARAV